MELHDFMGKFLPDSNERFSEYIKDFNPEDFGMDELDEQKKLVLTNFLFETMAFNLMKEIFPEALQNFADAICKRQRENCAEHYKNVFDDDWDASVYVHLFDAEQPNLDEILITEQNERNKNNTQPRL